MQPLHIILAILVAAIWGLNFVVIKIGLENFPPLLFSCLRFLLSALPAVFFLKKPLVSLKYIIGIGIVLGVIKFTFLFEGISLGMSAGLSSLVLQSQVFFSIIAARFIFHETISPIKMSGIGLGIIGIILIATQNDSSITPSGFAFTIGAAIAWSYSNILMRKMGKTKMLNFMVWMSLVPIIPMFLLSWRIEGLESMTIAITSIKPIGWAALLYVSFLTTVFGYAVWGWLLSQFPVGSVTPFALLIPIFGMLSSSLILGEQFTTIKLVASALILLGLAINTLGDKMLKLRK